MWLRSLLLQQWSTAQHCQQTWLRMRQACASMYQQTEVSHVLAANCLPTAPGCRQPRVIRYALQQMTCRPLVLHICGSLLYASLAFLGKQGLA